MTELIFIMKKRVPVTLMKEGNEWYIEFIVEEGKHVRHIPHHMRTAELVDTFIMWVNRSFPYVKLYLSEEKK
jgi:hypothetical protein